MPTSPSLRQRLAEAVAARRRAEDEALARVPVGVFTDLDRVPFIHFATTGRRTGQRREKFWGVYAAWGDTLYLLEEAGERADWVANVAANPRVEVWVRPGASLTHAHARLVRDRHEDAFARDLIAARLASDWGGLEAHPLVVAFDA